MPGVKGKRLSGLIVSLILFMSIPINGFSQDEDNAHNQLKSGGYIYFSLPFSTLDKNSADREGLKDNSIGFEFGFHAFFYKYLLTGINIGADFPGDNKEFSQLTTFGRMSSSVTVPYTSLCLGFKSPRIVIKEQPELRLAGNLVTGNMWIFKARRSIDQCEDCREDKINLDAGIYVEPEIQLLYITQTSFMIGISVGYKYFINSDYEKSILVNFLMGK